MPVSERQQKFMALCAHHPEHAKGKCPDKQIAKELSHKPKKGYK